MLFVPYLHTKRMKDVRLMCVTLLNLVTYDLCKKVDDQNLLNTVVVGVRQEPPPRKNGSQYGRFENSHATHHHDTCSSHQQTAHVLI